MGKQPGRNQPDGGPPDGFKVWSFHLILISNGRIAGRDGGLGNHVADGHTGEEVRLELFVRRSSAKIG